MEKATIAIRVNNSVENVSGYVDERGIGVHRMFGVSGNKAPWVITDLATGFGISKESYPTLKSAESGIESAIKTLEGFKMRKPECYADYVTAFSKLTGKVNTEVKKESEGKKMAKTTSKKSASKKATAKADTNKSLEKENKALKKELEILKKQIEELTRVEKVNIDSFDVEGYMANRDDSNRITEELVSALENTEGLVVTRKGEDKWLYVQGKTTEDTKSRKEIFKTMGFRWSGRESAWFIAPYPLANGKRYAARKARKASANA